MTCWLILLVAASGCSKPDPRSPEGAIAWAAKAVERGDARMLYHVIDERARHAMHSIVHDRRAAAELIREAYPAEERPRALALLGDAATVTDAAGLFEAQCPRTCMEELGHLLGAPSKTERKGEILVVHTARGTTFELYRGSDTWWGIVFRTEAFSAERNRANQALQSIRANAEIYRRSRTNAE